MLRNLAPDALVVDAVALIVADALELADGDPVAHRMTVTPWRVGAADERGAECDPQGRAGRLASPHDQGPYRKPAVVGEGSGQAPSNASPSVMVSPGPQAICSLTPDG